MNDVKGQRENAKINLFKVFGFYIEHEDF